MTFKTGNNLSSTLSAQLLSGGTSVTLQTGQGANWAAANGTDYILAVLYNTAGTKREIVKVTNRSGDTLTISRNQETIVSFSPPYQFEVGDFIESRVTSGLLDTLVSDVTTNSPIGQHTIWVPAAAMTPRTTSGAALGTVETTTNKVMIRTLDFDQTTDEFAQFNIRMPKGWNESTVTAYFLWSSNIAGTNSVVWGLQGVAISNDDALDSAFGTAQTVTDAQTAQGDLMQSDVTSAITIGGSPAENDWVVFQVYRDADNGSDNLAGDARLHGVTLIYTISSATDA